MTAPCLVARCRACGKIGAASFIGREKNYEKDLGKIVQKVLRGYSVAVESGPIEIGGCGCTETQRIQAVIDAAQERKQ